MLIECRVRRERTITIGDDAYPFKRDDQDRFVAEVVQEPHIKRFMEIPEYRAVPEDNNTPPIPAQAFTSVGKAIPQDDEQPAEEADADPLDIDSLSDDELVSEYLEAFGSAPHHKMKRETIVNRLKAHYEDGAE